MKVLIDTNIILDVLAKREPYYKNSAEILKLAETGKLTAFITANSVTDIFFILRKHIRDKEVLKNTVQKLTCIVDIANVLKSDVLKAFEMDFSDFEDALLARCAKRIKADYLITRNKQDFTKSPVEAITPEEFLKKIKEV